MDMKKQFDVLLEKALNEGSINANDFGFLKVEHPVIAAFCQPPKEHKGPEDTPSGHPIISDNGTVTEPASKCTDFCIKPLVRKAPSPIEGSTDVLN